MTVADLFSRATRREGRSGPHLVFYWTLNPILASYGDVVFPVKIYQRVTAYMVMASSEERVES